MVKTGARAKELERLLTHLGHRPVPSRTGPRIDDLSPERQDHVIRLYRELGGASASPRLRPGAWDLAFDGDLLVELDEELHFNRYRRVTLAPSWTADLPWRDDYLNLTSQHEADCLAAARWGKRWTSASCEAMFGPADPPGTFTSGGAPRWKQRALYDAMKDAAAHEMSSTRVARLATVDVVAGVRLGDALEGRAAVDLDALQEMVLQRSTRPQPVARSGRLSGDRRGTAPRSG